MAPGRKEIVRSLTLYGRQRLRPGMDGVKRLMLAHTPARGCTPPVSPRRLRHRPHPGVHPARGLARATGPGQPTRSPCAHRCVQAAGWRPAPDKSTADACAPPAHRPPPRQDQQELLAADPKHRIRGAQTAQQVLRHTLEHIIAFQMAVLVALKTGLAAAGNREIPHPLSRPGRPTSRQAQQCLRKENRPAGRCWFTNPPTPLSSPAASQHAPIAP